MLYACITVDDYEIYLLNYMVIYIYVYILKILIGMLRNGNGLSSIFF